MVDFLVQHMSYMGIIAVLVLTGTGLPLPEEIPVLLAGIASHSGQLQPWLAFLSCVVGALMGDCVMYGIGYHFGHNVVRDHPWFARFLTPEREQSIERMIQKHGIKVYFLARFLVGIRSPMFLTAGILKVPVRTFLLVDTFCATAVIGVFFGLSYYFAAQIMSWFKWIRGFEIILTVVVVAAVVSWAWIYIRRRRLRWQRVQDRRQQRSLRNPASPESTNVENESPV